MENNKVTFAPGMFTLLGVLFVGLKLTDVIDWSWWLVVLPFFVPLLLIILTFVLGAGILGTVIAASGVNDWRKKLRGKREAAAILNLRRKHLTDNRKELQEKYMETSDESI